MRFKSDSTARRPVMERRVSRREALAAGAALMTGALGCSQQVQPSNTSVDTIADGTRKPNIVVFLADAMRPDHLSWYGYPLPTTPHLDALARNSLVFNQCYAQSPWTKPSIASLFTGLMPEVHQAGMSNWDVDNIEDYSVQLLRDDCPIFAKEMQALGYNTALFQSNPHVQDVHGFAQGFDYYRFVFAEEASEQVDAAIAWLQNEAQEPFCLFIHEFAPHGPYLPRDSFFEDLFGASRQSFIGNLPLEDQQILNDNPGRFNEPLLALTPAGIEVLKQLYDAEILEVDFHFHRLMNAVEKDFGIQNSVVAFISDHGEAFGEHGHFLHANAMYDEELHVPFLLHIGWQARGLTVPWNVSLSDLFPSLQTLAGGTPPAELQAETLVDASGALAVHDHRRVYAAWCNEDMPFCLIDGAYKAITGDTPTIHRGQDKPPLVFNRAEDPGEQTNLMGTDSRAQGLVAELLEMRRKNLLLAKSFGEPAWSPGNEQTLHELRTIGYL